MSIRQRILTFALGLFGVAAHASDFDGRYISRTGDLNGDGRSDIYVQYQPKFAFVDVGDIPVPIPATKPPISEFVLQGTTTGSFDLVSSLSPAQRGAARSWQKATMPLVRGDYNADGNVDIRVKRVASSIAGANDALIFSPSAAGTGPIAIHSLDASTMQFVGDFSGWVNDPSYFQSGWRLVQTIIYNGYAWPTYRCNGILYPDISGLNPGPVDPIFGTPGAGSLPNNGIGCTFVGNLVWNGVVVNVYAFDASGFNARALSAARLLAPYRQGNNQFVLSAADSTALKLQFEQVFGVVFGTTTTWPGAPPLDWEWLRWWSRVNPLILAALIINTAIPNSTADDDELNQFHHYSFLSLAPSIGTLGLLPPVFLTQGRIMSGPEANQNLGLTGPTRDAVYFVLLPETWPLAGPMPIPGGAAGWQQWVSAEGIPPVYISPPRPLPP